MKFNVRVITSILGLLVAINGAFMILCLPFSMYYNENWAALLLSGLFTLGVGLAIWLPNKNVKDKVLKKKEGYLVVTLGWLIISIFGSLPYMASGVIPNFTDAFFETISGFSTTGASVITDIEAQPKGILFWRSLTQWIGGMGIIVLTVAILPLLGIGGMQLFVAEAPGITPDKLKPRIKDTALRLWIVYASLTLLECILLMFGGMSFYDAINHALTTMATGGFSTKNDSIATQSPYIQYVLIIFMFLAGTNFTLNYFGLKGKLGKVWENEEFRFYLGITVLFGIIMTFGVYSVTGGPFEKAFRDALFQVISVITTTGFVSADYTVWSPFITTVFFLFMFLGGSAGSTAGGVKIVRHVILFKNSFLEMKRQLHTSAVIPVRLNNKAVSRDITFNVLAFIMIYLLIFTIGIMLMSFTGLDFTSSFGAVATSLGNVGPGLGSVGPVDNFAHVSGFGKWVLSMLMLLGRLELFTVLMLLTPYYWKR